MSQPSSSIISNDNAEVKYKKALKEISKLIQANRVLRQGGDKTVQEMKDKYSQLQLRYEHLAKQFNNVQKEKQSLSHYINQMQKERNNLQRQLGYLNDALAEQNAELKKIHMQKDQRAVATLLRTYQEKEASMNRHRAQNEELITKLKMTIQRLQSQVQHQRILKDENEQRFSSLSLDMDQLKQQNLSLHDQIQRLLKESSQKDSYNMQKQKELRSLVSQFQKQINLMRNIQDEGSRGSRGDQVEGYETLLNEKNRLSLQLTKLQTACEQQMVKQKQYFEMQQRMKTARLQWERANQQINMLKSKIVVLEAKQFLEEAGDDDSDQKFFEQRLNILLSQNDPLLYIKNQQDSSHFRILKAFIVDLQDKIYKINSQRKQINRKYKSIKTKFVKNAQQLSHLEQQHKLMKGKLQGYQRLTQKLQFELERSIASHEDQITRMTITSNNIISKKIEEYKVTINLLNSQLEINQDKANRTQKNYKQEIQTLRLQLDTFKIKFRDQTDKSGKDNELIQLYKRKNNEMSSRINTLEEQLANNSENLSKFEHLYKQQKGKNQGLLSQKQQLLAQTRQLSQQIDKKATSFSGTFKIKQEQYQFQITKYKTQNQRLKNQVQQLSRQVGNYQKDLEEVRRGDQSQVGEIKRLTFRNTQLQGKLSQLKRRIRDLQEQNETVKIKCKKYQQNYQRNIKFEQQNIYKSDKINDLTRQKITLQNELKNAQFNLTQQSKLNQQLKKELASIKIKSLQSNHESKRQFQNKLLQNRKSVQSLNQQISDLSTQLREQKSKNLRLTNELNTAKSQKNRIQQIMDQNRKRDIHSQTQVGNIKIQLSNAQMEIQRLQSQIRNHLSQSGTLNQQIQTLQQKIFNLNQDISNLKMKLQTAEDLKNDLVRDLSSMKITLVSVESHSSNSRKNINLSWEDQTFYSSLVDIITKIKRICRNYGIIIESASSSYQSYQQPYIKPVVIETKTKGDGYQEFFKTYSEPVQQSSQSTFTFKNVQSLENDFSPKYTSNQFQYGKTDLSNSGANNVPVSHQPKTNTNTGSGGYFEYYKSYAQPTNQQGGLSTRNFQSSLGTTQSVGKVQYSFSPGKNDLNQGINNSSFYKQMQFSYSGGDQ